MTPLTDTAAWLFCPADRPDRYERARDACEVVIIDLEDAVAPADKAAARAHVVAAAPWDPARTIVRINAPGTPASAADVDALRDCGIQHLMLPMASSQAQVEALEGFAVIPLCETAAGILAAPQIAAASNCVAITWGIEDLTLELGANGRDPAGRLTPAALFAQTAVRYAASAAGIPAIDTVWVAMDDLDGLSAEARAAAEAGFAGKMILHPRQAPPVVDAFHPTDEQLQRAREIVTAAASASSGAVAYHGQMLDRPVIARAERLLQRARPHADS